MVKENGWKQDVFHGINCVFCGVDNKGVVGHASQEAAAMKWNRRA
jgi:hypothetical protein